MKKNNVWWLLVLKLYYKISMGNSGSSDRSGSNCASISDNSRPKCIARCNARKDNQIRDCFTSTPIMSQEQADCYINAIGENAKCKAECPPDRPDYGPKSKTSDDIPLAETFQQRRQRIGK